MKSYRFALVTAFNTDGTDVLQKKLVSVVTRQSTYLGQGKLKEGTGRGGTIADPFFSIVQMKEPEDKL